MNHERTIQRDDAVQEASAHKATSSSSKKARLYKSTSESRAHTSSVLAMSFTPDGQHIVSLGKDNALRMWSCVIGANWGLNTLVDYGKVFTSAEHSLQLSFATMTNSSESCVFVPSGASTLMFDLFGGALKASFKGHFETVNCCMYNPTIGELYTGAKDRNAFIWSPDLSVRPIGCPSPPHRYVQTTLNVDSYRLTSEQRMSTTSATTTRTMDTWSDDDDTWSIFALRPLKLVFFNKCVFIGLMNELNYFISNVGEGEIIIIVDKSFRAHLRS